MARPAQQRAIYVLDLFVGRLERRTHAGDLPVPPFLLGPQENTQDRTVTRVKLDASDSLL